MEPLVPMCACVCVPPRIPAKKSSKRARASAVSASSPLTASVSLSVQAQEVSTSLVEARHEGSLLEVEVSALSNPTRIQEAANELGMISPETATVIKLGEDVVVTNAQGDLSLAESLRVAARNS